MTSSPRARRFSQVDVFSDTGLLGNALAVVHDADDLDEATMAAFARWTNLSETTFLLAPTPEGAAAGADYRVRIFTVGGELPFAGHPTIGSATAWAAAGGRPARDGVVVQECGVGLVELRAGERLAFAAPDLLRSGPVDPARAGEIRTALGLGAEQVLGMSWIDNGPGWIGIELGSAEEVLAVEPDPTLSQQLKVALAGRWADPEAAGKDVEVRAFYGDGVQFMEDPVTGSANAGLAQWLIGAGRLPERYVAGQGARVQRDGRIHVEAADGQVWVGGDAVVTVAGEVTI